MLEPWRALDGDLHLVDSTRVRPHEARAGAAAATLPGRGVDAVNLHHSDWTGGLTTLFHRFGVLAFGWDAQHERVLDELLDIGHRRRLQRPRRPHGRRPRSSRLTPLTAGPAELRRATTCRTSRGPEIMNARPTIRLVEMGPKHRPSWEFTRLSPITNTRPLGMSRPCGVSMPCTTPVPQPTVASVGSPCT